MKTYIPTLKDYMSENVKVTRGKPAQKMGSWPEYDIENLEVGDFVKVDKDQAMKSLGSKDKKVFMSHWDRSGAKRDGMMYVAGVTSSGVEVAGSKTSAMMDTVEIPIDSVIAYEDITERIDATDYKNMSEARIPKDEQVEIIRDYLLAMGLEEISASEAEKMINKFADNGQVGFDKYSISAVYLKDDTDTETQLKRQLIGLSMVEPEAKYFHVSKSPLGYSSKSRKMKRSNKKNVFVHGLSDK